MPSRSRGILISASAAVRTTSRNISLTAVVISAELLDGWLLTYAFNRFRENSIHFLLVFLLLTAPNFFMLSSAAVYTKIYRDTKTISRWTTSLQLAPPANAADSALVQIIFAAASTLLSPPECALPGSKSYGVNVVYNQEKDVYQEVSMLPLNKHNFQISEETLCR